nr:MAG TPA: hypothetical protein [Caudoviricetes sp.]
MTLHCTNSYALSLLDSNKERQSQSLSCYHYTKGQDLQISNFILTTYKVIATII